MRRQAMAVVVLAFAAWSPLAANWPQAGGPDRAGVVGDDTVVVPEPGIQPKVAWQANVGYGWGPVVVSQDRVYAYGVFRPDTTPDSTGDIATTPTYAEAAAAGRRGTVALLLDREADVNARDNSGTSPAQLAATSGHSETADLLREWGGMQ